MSKREIWAVRRRLFLVNVPFRTYRTGLSREEAIELAEAHNRAFPKYLHVAVPAPRKRKKANDDV